MKKAPFVLLAVFLASTASAVVVRVAIAPVQGLAGTGAAATNPSILKVADLPPAGPQTVLDAPQLRWLYRTLVAAPYPVLSRQGFSALVLGHDMAMVAAVPSADRGDVMYQSLQRVVDSDLSPSERGNMAYALNQRFTAILDEVLHQSSLSAKDRLILERTKGEYLEDPAVLEELMRRREVLSRLHAFEKAVQEESARLDPSAGAVAEPAHEQWSIGVPIPKSDRVRGGGVQEIQGSLSRLSRYGEAQSFKFEKLLKRWEIVSRGDFSPRFKEKIRLALDEMVLSSLDLVRNWNEWVSRITTFTLPRSFCGLGTLDARRGGILFVPDNKNLRLRVEMGVAQVTVDFETDIANAEALKTIKASIEDYWSGEFVSAGKKLRFKTTVNIRRIAAGHDFSPGSLTLSEAVDVVPHAGRNGIVFSRDLRYDAPAHEFGHVLGLKDEYTEGYRPSDRTAVSRQNTESLMGAMGGDILPRQLKTAYQLLRRRSLRN